MAYQSLYRRYRPQRFGEVVGQEHATEALRRAVAEERTGHAYLFSGPRGTGKTSTARILAKALNCTDLADGEPCGACESCVAMEAGTSYDLFELDAASNNKVDEMRDLISRVAVGSPGRRKVYILDEVHMLTAGSSNALLKTLEEPPDHVTFVLATTDPQKVLPTIRSRTQHFEFGLIPTPALEAHVRTVVADAGLGVDDEAIASVIRQGAGSARDTLSALDQVVAAGGAIVDQEPIDEIVEALCESDTAAALVGVASAIATGREPRLLGESMLDRLRDAFLIAMKTDLAQLPDQDRPKVADWAARLGPARITRALEQLGEALIEIRQAADPRIPLEVALVKLTKPAADRSVEALAERVSQLEARLAGATTPSPAHPSVPPKLALVESVPEVPDPPVEPSVSATEPTEPPGTGPRGPAAEARRRLAEAKAQRSIAEPRPTSSASDPVPEPAPGPTTTASPEPAGDPESEPEPVAEPATAASAPAGELPDHDALVAAWDSAVLDSVSKGARAMFRAGRFVGEVDGRVQFALPNPIHRDRCQNKLPEVNDALAAHFGRAIPLELVVDGDPPPPEDPLAPAPKVQRASEGVDDEEDIAAIGDVRELPDADVATTTLDRLTEAFPGAELVDGD